jgi:hypothetical protein
LNTITYDDLQGSKAIWPIIGIGFLLLMLAGCTRAPQTDEVSAFLARHWADPVPAQGPPPASYTPVEASLAPESCANCHPAQYQDWRSALHSRAMGPGIYWQFEKLGQGDGNRCLRCHAPLAEQKALLAREMGWPNAPKDAPPDYVPPDLAHQGLACAACHVRNHVRYGPPGPQPSSKTPPHDGFVAAKAFQDSRFCAQCHQFPQDGPKLAGKLREDTYQQWLSSRYAPSQPCQSCHMANGRHLWRGIHDPDMVRKALAVELNLVRLQDGRYQAEVIARNKGAGHHLPTYLVPKIDLVLLLERTGQPDIELARDVIGWHADVNFEHEDFDTRIPAGASRRYLHGFQPPKGAWKLLLRVDVAPGEHYERMFHYSQGNVSLTPGSGTLLQQAIKETEGARFTALQISAEP